MPRRARLLTAVLILVVGWSFFRGRLALYDYLGLTQKKPPSPPSCVLQFSTPTKIEGTVVKYPLPLESTVVKYPLFVSARTGECIPIEYILVTQPGSDRAFWPTSDEEWGLALISVLSPWGETRYTTRASDCKVPNEARFLLNYP